MKETKQQQQKTLTIFQKSCCIKPCSHRDEMKLHFSVLLEKEQRTCCENEKLVRTKSKISEEKFNQVV